MASVAEHYERHLAPIYLWMAGGFDYAISCGETEIRSICPDQANGFTAVDLGAGFGMHTIPLARRGYAVIAIDTSVLLLGILQDHTDTLSIRTVEGDLGTFHKYLAVKFATDTIEEVSEALVQVCKRLDQGN